MNSTNPNPHLALADAAEQRANAATPGEWWQGQWSGQCKQKHIHDGKACIYEYTRREGGKCVSTDTENTVLIGWNEDREVLCYEADAIFIANAKQDVPALADAVREQAATIAALQAKLTEALALAEAGYEEGVADAEFNHLCISKANPLWPKVWAASETRAAVERLRNTP